MTTVSAWIDASPDRTFDVLSDPPSYGDWVVGSKHIRRHDPEWPKPGSEFHHTLGVGPITIHDLSRVLESERPARLVLEVHSGALGDATVVFELTAARSGTTIHMTETPLRGLMHRLPRPLVDGAIWLRNTETLRRLKRAVESG